MPDDMKSAINAWLSLITGSVIAYRRDVNGPALAKHLQIQLRAAKPVLDKLDGRLHAGNWNKVISAIGTGKAHGAKGLPARPLANALFACKSAMRRKLSAFCLSPDINEAQIKLAKAAIALFDTDSARVDQKDVALDKQLHTLPDRLIKQMAVPSASPDQQGYLKELEHIVTGWTKRKDTRLSVDESKKFKLKDPEVYKRYLKLRGMVNDSWKSFIRAVVRESGGQPIKVADAIALMREEGITQHPYAKLERLYVGEDCALYTSAGKRIAAMPAPGSEIVFNKNYHPQKDDGAVFMFKVPLSKAARGGWAYAYTDDLLRQRRTDKYAKVASVMDKLPKQRERWLRDLFSGDLHRATLGAMAELLYSHSMRIGGAANKTDGKATYGLTTLLARHVHPRNGGYILSYAGKKGMIQKHVIKPDSKENARVIKVISRMMRGKGRTDPLWTDPQSNRYTAGEVNRYLRSLGIKITAHKFRHARGSALMRDLLAKSKIPKNATQPQVEKAVKDLAIKVGTLLGHFSKSAATGKTKVVSGTAIKSYLDPSIIAEFFQNRGLRRPAWLPKTGDDED